MSIRQRHSVEKLSVVVVLYIEHAYFIILPIRDDAGRSDRIDRYKSISRLFLQDKRSGALRKPTVCKISVEHQLSLAATRDLGYSG